MEAVETTKVDFETMTLVQKINAIDSIIDEKVRDYLHADGGDLDLIEVKETEDFTNVYISYLGACGSCNSSDGTKDSIQRILNGQLETRKINVLVV